jgi:glycosyltransferase involved in cell wall biosynthesis
MSAKPLISVVLTTYNRSDALAVVLAALQRQTDKDFEVVIADDGSQPAHRARIRETANRCSFALAYVWHPDVGFTVARARNLGVAQSRGSYLILLDGDCVPDVDFIAQHRRLMQTGFLVNGSRCLLSPDFTQRVLGGSVDIVGRSWQYWLQQWRTGYASKIAPRLRVPDVGMRIESDFRWHGIRSCNMGLWRSDFEVVNGFDSSFQGWGHEDADLVLRMFHAGIRRKNGFFATEVFHLWHEEASRNRASANEVTVQQRMHSDIVRAPLGLQECRAVEDFETWTFTSW